jgi:hypothetical protein
MRAKVNILFFMVLLFDWLKSLLIEMVKLAREKLLWVSLSKSAASADGRHGKNFLGAAGPRWPDRRRQRTRP